MTNVNSCTGLHYEQCGQQIQESHYPSLLSACESSHLTMLWACSLRKMRNWRGPRVGLLWRLQVWRRGWRSSACLFWWEELKGNLLGACNYMKWQRLCNQTLHRCYERHYGPKLGQNIWTLEDSNWSLGKYSSLEEQCRTGRGYLQKR